MLEPVRWKHGLTVTALQQLNSSISCSLFSFRWCLPEWHEHNDEKQTLETSRERHTNLMNKCSFLILLTIFAGPSHRLSQNPGFFFVYFCSATRHTHAENGLLQIFNTDWGPHILLLFLWRSNTCSVPGKMTKATAVFASLLRAVFSLANQWRDVVHSDPLDLLAE